MRRSAVVLDDLAKSGHFELLPNTILWLLEICLGLPNMSQSSTVGILTLGMGSSR